MRCRIKIVSSGDLEYTPRVLSNQLASYVQGHKAGRYKSL